MITPAGVAWAGPTDPEPDAPIVACELAVALEPAALAEFVASAPIPGTLLRELAARCPPGDDGDDPRWRRARAAAAIARGDAAGEVRDERGTCIDRGIDALRVLHDGTLVRLRGTELVIGEVPAIVLPVVESGLYGLPTPLAPDAIDADLIVVTIYTHGRVTMLVFDTRGRELARAETAIDWLPERVSYGRAGYWLHGRDDHHRVGHASHRRPYVRGGETLSRRWLLAIDHELAWISLDTGERRAFPWGHQQRTFVRVDDVLWCTTAEGLWRLRGGEAPVLVWSGDAWGLAVSGTRAWLGPYGTRSVVAVDLETGDEVWRAAIANDVYTLDHYENVIVANGLACLAPDGRILATTEPRRDLGTARLADGTVAASCGEQVVIVDPAGNVRRALPMPYDGQIVGATADRFLFGPVSGGEDRVRPTALVAFDRTGRVTARLVPPCRPHHVGDTLVHLIDYSTHELIAWNPHGATIGVTPPPPRRPTERGVRQIGYEVINPRDDRPEVGIELHADFLALDGTYGGSLGQFTEVPLRVADGAIATFARCDLTIGGNGSIAERASTIFLVECKLPAAEWTLGSACHLVIVGGEIGHVLRIHAPPPASVTITGLAARRAGNVWLVSKVAWGTPIVVDGAGYLWEIDNRSGALDYAARGKVVTYVHLTNSDGSTVSFEVPDGDLKAPGWWRGSFPWIPPETIERAVRIAGRVGWQGSRMLTTDETGEAFDGYSSATLQDGLVTAHAALPEVAGNMRTAFIRCVLAVGCRGDSHPEARTAIDDWVASYADELRAARAGLQAIVDETRTSEYGFANRSAIAFLIDWCARVNVDLGIDTAAADEQLRTRFRRTGDLPVGIPASHWWWNQPAVADPEDELPPQLR